MSGSDILDIAIGLAFLYLILSLVVTTLTEFISRAFAMRSKNLEDGIRNLLEGGETGENKKSMDAKVKELFTHPLIANLANKSKGLGPRKGKPSYIPSRSFSLALLDVVAPRDGNGEAKSFQQVRTAVRELPKALQVPLMAAFDDAGEDLAKARAGVEFWFDAAMDRVSGWYRRKTQLITVALGFLLTVLLNADTFTIGNGLFRDAAMRSAVVASALHQVEKGAGEPDLAALQETVASLQMPMGWFELVPKDPGTTGTGDGKFIKRYKGPVGWDWFGKILGLLFTGLAVSLGAPFWFDALNRLANLRATGPPPQVAQPKPPGAP